MKKSVFFVGDFNTPTYVTVIFDGKRELLEKMFEKIIKLLYFFNSRSTDYIATISSPLFPAQFVDKQSWSATDRRKRQANTYI